MVETSEGSVVLKVSGNIGLDYFMNCLCHCLGIPTPKMKILKY